MKEFSELDEMFREGLQNAQLTPPPGVWEGVSASLAAGSSTVGSSLIIAGKWIAASLVAGAAGVTAWYFSTRNHATEEVKPGIVRTPESREDIKSAAPVDNRPEAIATPQTGHPLQNRSSNNNTATGNNPLIRDYSDEASVNEGPVKGTIVKPHSYKDKTQVISREPAPVKHEIPSVIAECGRTLSLQYEKISNTAYAFTAIRPQGMVTWYFNNVQAGSGYQIAHEFPDIPGVYTVKVLSMGLQPGCRDSAIVKITVAGAKPELTNFFSPNGDGYNDFYYVEIRNTEVFELVIADAANRIVFSSNSPDARWDGTCRNIQCPEGNYQVTLTYRYPGESKVTVLRQKLLLTRNNE